MYGLTPILLQQLAEVFEAHPAIEQVTIFGSRATGKFREGSDIDLVIHLANALTFDLGSLADDIDQLNSPYLFDLVNFNEIQNEALLEHIKHHGKVLFKRSQLK